MNYKKNQKTKKICYNCENNVIDFKKSKVKDKIADWKRKMGLKTKYPNDEILPIKIQYPEQKNINYKLVLSKNYSGRYVYYFAAKKQMNKTISKIYPKEAYGKKFPNKGVAKVNENGIANLKLECPQPYYTDDKTKYIPHLHYLISDSNNKKWIEKLYTERIICGIKKLELNKIVNNSNHIIINALPYSEFIKNSIPNSISIPYSLFDDKNAKIKKINIINFIKNQLPKYRKLFKEYKKQNLKIENLPIVIYCYNTKCNASELLINKLIKFGFTDIKEYKGGIVDWFKCK